jgi:hypothetical protein
MCRHGGGAPHVNFRQRLEATTDGALAAVLADDAGDDPAPADETPKQAIARLQAELAQARTLLASQAAIIRTERSEKDAVKARLGEILALLRNDRISPTSRIVAVVLGETVEQLRSHGHERGEVLRADLARKAGVSESTITREMKQLCTDSRKPHLNPDAPILKTTVTEWRTVAGVQLPTSKVSIGWKDNVPIIRAFATFQPPEERKHGGRRATGCPEHPTADFIVRSTTSCAACGEQIGEPTETLRKQVDAVGGHDGVELVEVAASTARAAVPHPHDIGGAGPPAWLAEWPGPPELLTELPTPALESSRALVAGGRGWRGSRRAAVRRS